MSLTHTPLMRSSLQSGQSPPRAASFAPARLAWIAASGQSQASSSLQPFESKAAASPSVSNSVVFSGAIAPARLGILAKLSAGPAQVTESLPSLRDAALAPATVLPLRSRVNALIPSTALGPSLASQGSEPRAKTKARDAPALVSMERISSFMSASAPLGSSVRVSAAGAKASAHVALAYVEANHPSWLPQSQLTDRAIARELRLVALAARGQRKIDNARRALVRLDGFLAAHDRYFSGPDPLLGEEVIQWFVASVAINAADARGSRSKGEAGPGIVKALGAAVELLYAPISPAVLSSPAVISAAQLRPLARDLSGDGATKVAHMSVEVMLSLHDIACGFRPGSLDPLGAPPVFLRIAQGLYLAILLSLRFQDLRRCHVLGLHPEYLDVQCDATKGPSHQSLEPFRTRCPSIGLTGEPLPWLRSFHDHFSGKPFLVEGLIFSKRSLKASSSLFERYERASPSGAAIGEDQLNEAWDEVLGVIGFDPKHARSVCGLTGQAARHALADIALTFAWPLPARNMLGRWAPAASSEGEKRESQALLRRAMPNKYAEGLASIEREFALRSYAIAIIPTYLQSRPWRPLVPSQREGKPSFAFLLPRRLAPMSSAVSSEPVEDIEEFSSDDEGEPSPTAKRSRS